MHPENRVPRVSIESLGECFQQVVVRQWVDLSEVLSVAKLALLSTTCFSLMRLFVRAAPGPSTFFGDRLPVSVFFSPAHVAAPEDSPILSSFPSTSRL